MNAVIVEVDTRGVDRETGHKNLRENIVPLVRQLPGFQSGTWLVATEDRKGFALVLFDTEDNARAAAARFSVGANPQPGVTIERSEVREVAVTA
jgi:hypothetical protein